MSEWRVTSEYYDGGAPGRDVGRQPDDRPAEDAEGSDPAPIEPNRLPDDGIKPPAFAAPLDPRVTSEAPAFVRSHTQSRRTDD